MGIKIIIAGFKGKMGQAAYKMVTEDPELELVGLLDPFTDEKEVAGVPVFNAKEELAELDEITYVRFASVYRSFKDVSELENLLKQITQSSKKKKEK